MIWIIKCLLTAALVFHTYASDQEYETYRRLYRNEQPSGVTRHGGNEADFSRRSGDISFGSGQQSYNVPSGYGHNLNPEVSYEIDSHDIINDSSEEALQDKQLSNYDSDIIKILASNYRKKFSGPVKKIPFISKIQDNILNEPVPVSQHIEVSRPIPIPSYTHVPVGISKPYQITIPYPVLVPVPQPYPVEIPVNKPVAVPYIQEIKVPIEKIVLYPVIKNVPYPVTKHVPYPIEKQVTVKVSQPYPIEIPVLKNIFHKSKGSNHGIESFNNKFRKSDADTDNDYNGYDEQDDESDYESTDQRQSEGKSSSGAKERYSNRDQTENKDNNNRQRHSNQDKQSPQYNKGYGKNSKYISYKRYT